MVIISRGENMKFGRIKQLYRYEVPDWKLDGNIGDCIQNIAVENLYKELGILSKDLIQINRDEINCYKGEKVLLPMQGWFGNTHNVFPVAWSEDIIPIFVGYHLNPMNNGRDIFKQLKIQNKMVKFEPVGCRDKNTRNFLNSLGVNAYFSRCLTLTLPKREAEPENGKIFLVNLTDKAYNIVPDCIKKVADESISHTYYFKNYPITEGEGLEFEDKAREILKRYKEEAKLVITSKIHCAMPCLAMGIPVIFIHDFIHNPRFDVLDGVIPIYTTKRRVKIDWDPVLPNIEDLKTIIKENAMLQICRAAEKYGLNLNRHFSDEDEKRIMRSMYSGTNIIHLLYFKFKRFIMNMNVNEKGI